MLPPMAGLPRGRSRLRVRLVRRWAASAGAASVLGIDLSEKMLARAATVTPDDRITYQRQDLDDVELPADEFDVAYSSLALHYLADLDRIVATSSPLVGRRWRVRVLDRAPDLLLAVESASSSPTGRAMCPGRSIGT